jgi:four helix bundle protein
MNIALKEAYETLYWLRLLNDTGLVDKKNFDQLYGYADELVKMLASIVKTTKNSIS